MSPQHEKARETVSDHEMSVANYQETKKRIVRNQIMSMSLHIELKSLPQAANIGELDSLVGNTKRILGS